MTETPLVSIVIPVGRDAGGERDDTGKVTYPIVLGSSIHSLNETEYTLWRLAHGVAGAAGLPAFWGAGDTIAAAEARGIRDPTAVIATLHSRELLYELRYDSEDVANFAVVHRPVPLVFGASDLVAGDGRFAVGTRHVLVADTNAMVQEVFNWAAMFENLWSNCENIAQRAASGSIQMQEQWRAPEAIAQIFLFSCRELLAAQAICFDLHPAKTGAA